MISVDPAAICPNCGAERLGRYCQSCGQDNRHPTPRVRDWWAVVVDTLFSLDGRWLRTLRELSWDPGGVVRRYLAGQRVRYVAPVRYALVTCAIWWVFVLVQIPDLSDPRINPGLRVVLRYGQPLNLVMLPALAVGFWFAFLGTRLSYAAHACFLMLVSGHVFLWRAGLAALGWWQPGWGPTLNALDPWFAGGYVALAAFFWQRPPGRIGWRHGLLLLRIALALYLLFLGSGRLMEWLVRLLLWLG